MCYLALLAQEMAKAAAAAVLAQEMAAAVLAQVTVAAAKAEWGTVCGSKRKQSCSDSQCCYSFLQTQR